MAWFLKRRVSGNLSLRLMAQNVDQSLYLWPSDKRGVDNFQ
jgi:hypothetical protein